MRTTSRPCSAAASAAHIPAPPAPTTMTSTSSGTESGGGALMAQNCNRFYYRSVTSQAAAPSAVEAAVERLARALETRVPCAPVRDLIGTDDLAAAYAVQQGLVRQ